MESITIYCRNLEEKEALQKVIKKMSAFYDLRTAELINKSLKDFHETHKKEIENQI